MLLTFHLKILEMISQAIIKKIIFRFKYVTDM